MDSSLSHDPFMPDSDAHPDFRVQRWVRAGATHAERIELGAAFRALSEDDQKAEDLAIDTTSDNALAGALERMRATGDLAGYRAAPAAEEPSSGEESGETEHAEGGDAEGAQGDAGTSELTPEQVAEAAAAHGAWEPAELPLEVDGESYPAWNLVGDWVGTLIGDEVDGVHLVRANREELAAAVTELLVAQKAG